jgi:hypothetical protein
MGDTPRGRGGKGPRGPGGGRRGGPRRDDRRGEPSGGRAAGRVDEVTVVVDRREGARVLKVSRVEHASHRVVGVVYRVEFEGRAPMDFDRLGAARDRAQGPPPEPPAPQRPMARPHGRRRKTRGRRSRRPKKRARPSSRASRDLRDLIAEI